MKRSKLIPIVSVLAGQVVLSAACSNGGAESSDTDTVSDIDTDTDMDSDTTTDLDTGSDTVTDTDTDSGTGSNTYPSPRVSHGTLVKGPRALCPSTPGDFLCGRLDYHTLGVRE